MNIGMNMHMRNAVSGILKYVSPAPAAGRGAGRRFGCVWRAPVQERVSVTPAARLALMVVAAGMLATKPAPARLAMGLALVLLLIAKLIREEKLLRAAYPDYAAYQASTWRLVPWIW